MKRRNLFTIAVMVFALAFLAPAVLSVPAGGVDAAKKTNKVALSKTKVTVPAGKKFTLILKNNKKKVTWKSANKKVAAVTQKGLVITKKAGRVNIYAKVGKKYYKCLVIVKQKGAPVNPDVTLTQLGIKTFAGKAYLVKGNKDEGGNYPLNPAWKAYDKAREDNPDLDYVPYYTADPYDVTVDSVSVIRSTKNTSTDNYVGTNRYEITITGKIPAFFKSETLEEYYVYLAYNNNDGKKYGGNDYYLKSINSSDKDFDGVVSTFTRDDSGNFTLTVTDYSIIGQYTYFTFSPGLLENLTNRTYDSEGKEV